MILKFKKKSILFFLVVLAFVRPLSAEEKNVATTKSALAAAEKKEDAEFICGDRVEMGTPFKICLVSPKENRLTVEFDIQNAFRKIAAINAWMSEWQEETDLSQVNRAAGAEPVKVRAELFDLMKYTLGVCAKTDGAFDPTFNAFWGLYSFKEGHHREPTDEEIKERLPLVNYRKIELDEQKKTIFLKSPGMKLGLGGLGQGYAVDAVLKDLQTHYKAGFVDGSGDTYFWGKKPNGSNWIAAVRDPRDHNKNILRIYGTDVAVTTSGDDEKFFMVGDRRVHHIIDPRTGRPTKGVRQVTVISRRALDADAYDTSVMVLGPSRGKKLLEDLGFEGVIVTDSEVVLTKGLKKTQSEWGEVYLVPENLK